jgi:hypothetical protein
VVKRGWNASALHKSIGDFVLEIFRTLLQLFRDIASWTCPRMAACDKIAGHIAGASGFMSRAMR